MAAEAAKAAEVTLSQVGEPGGNTLSANKLSVRGPVTIDNVVTVAERGIVLFDRENLIIDLGPVTDVDSSAVSVLLQWEREARRRNRQIHFENVPQKLQSLIRLYEVSELIHWIAESSPDSAVLPKGEVL
jgi:phospholipid transport system transporter-binding protein